MSREFKEAVATFPWRDFFTVVTGSVAAWLSSFPSAVAINLKGRSDLTLNEFKRLSDIVELDLTGCI